MSKKVTLLYVFADFPAITWETDPEADGFEKYLGDELYEIPDFFIGASVICNFRGEAKGFSRNRTLDNGVISYTVYGSFFIVGKDGEGGYRSLSEDETAYYMDLMGYENCIIPADAKAGIAA